MMAVTLLYFAFTMCMYVPVFWDLQDIFLEEVLDFVIGLFSIHWDDYVLFFFQFVYTVDYIDRFLWVEPSLDLWNEAYLIMVDDFLMCS